MEERGADHAAKSLLSCCVPELEANFEAVDIDLLSDEEGTGCGRDVLGIKFVLRIPMKETRLSDACAEISEWI